MNRKIAYQTVVFFFLASFFFGFCAIAAADEAAASKPSDLRCRFQPGQSYRMKISGDTLYKTWVEMPGKKSSNPNEKNISREIILQYKVQSVAEDGAALINVTFEKFAYDAIVDVNGKKNRKQYDSTLEKTTSDYPNEPKLAGHSYQVKLASDTTVSEIIGLAALRNELKLSDAKTGLIERLLKDDVLKKLHLSETISQSPDQVASTQEPALPKQYDQAVEAPNIYGMVKAKAIKKKYTVQPPQKKDNVSVVLIQCEGEPLFVLPENMTEPAQPNDFYPSIIKEKSEMQEFTFTGQTLFDLDKRQLLKETAALSCTLVLDGDKVGFGGGKEEGAGGYMYTQISTTEQMERID